MHPTISNKQHQTYEFIQAISPKNSRSKERKEAASYKERLFLNLRDQNIENVDCGDFTFDIEKRQTFDSKKVLKNCFSTNEMTKLVNKVHFRH